MSLLVFFSVPRLVRKYAPLPLATAMRPPSGATTSTFPLQHSNGTPDAHLVALASLTLRRRAYGTSSTEKGRRRFLTGLNTAGGGVRATATVRDTPSMLAGRRQPATFVMTSLARPKRTASLHRSADWLVGLLVGTAEQRVEQLLKFGHITSKETSCIT